MQGRDLVLVQLTDGNAAKHPVNYQGTRYGQRKHGERFYIQREHLPYLLVKEVTAEAETAEVAATVETVVTPLAAPTLEAPAIVEPDAEAVGLNALFDWNDEQLEQLGAQNVYAVADVLKIGEEGLVKIKGIGKSRAAYILEKARGLVNQGG